MLEVSNLAHQEVPYTVEPKMTERISGILNLG